MNYVILEDIKGPHLFTEWTAELVTILEKYESPNWLRNIHKVIICEDNCVTVYYTNKLLTFTKVKDLAPLPKDHTLFELQDYYALGTPPFDMYSKIKDLIY